MINTINA